MKTLVAKQIAGNDRPWFVVDAKGQTLGRLSTQIAKILSGRNRVDFTPHIDNWAYVIVINAEKIEVTWQKETTKMYRTHSGYMGWLKEVSLEKMREIKPETIITHAVSGMLPKNKLRANMIDRLKVCVWESHKYEAQKPEILSL